MGKLFVGLGGTGVGVLSRLAEKIKNDTDLIAEIESNNEVTMWFVDADKIDPPIVPGINMVSTPISVINTTEVQENDYDRFENFRNWFDPEYRTAGNINTKESPGAGQIKLSGRYSFYNNIGNIQSIENNVTKNLSDDTLVYIVSSMFGGTGAGILYDVAYYIKEKMNYSDIHYFLLDPSILEILGNRGIFPHSWNAAYPSYIELDYWMLNKQSRKSGYEMIYDHVRGLSVRNEDPVVKNAILFGGQDSQGKTLVPKGQDKFDTYKEFMASVLFDTSFNNEILQFSKRNVLDNIISNNAVGSNGHSNAFISYGITYLRFPVENIRNYFINKFIAEDVKHHLLSDNKDSYDRILRDNERAEQFLSEQNFSEQEKRLIRKNIETGRIFKSLKDNYERHIKKIRGADECKDVRKNISFDFEKLKDENFKLIRKAIEKTDSRSGNKVGFKPQLDARINDLLVRESESVINVKSFLESLEDLIERDIKFLEDTYKVQIEHFDQNNYQNDVNSTFSKMRNADKKFFFLNTKFDIARKQYLNTLQNYFNGTINKLYYFEAKNGLDEILSHVKKWIIAVDYLIDRLEERVKNSKYELNNSLREFSRTPFINDNSGDENEYIFELFIGNYLDFINSKLVSDKVTSKYEKAKDEIFRQLNNGSTKTKGLAQVLLDIFKTDERELNNERTTLKIKTGIDDLIAEFVNKKIGGYTDSLKFWGVFDEHMEYLYSKVKDLIKRKDENKKEFDETVGKMRAMFGTDNGNVLIEALSKRAPMNIEGWIKESQKFLLSSIEKSVSPMWYVDKKYLNQVSTINKTFVPNRGKKNINRMLYDDRAVFFAVNSQFQLQHLSDDILEEFQVLYDEHKKTKQHKASSIPYHVDNRFYNEWQWDIIKDASKQGDAELLQYFAFGLAMPKNDKSRNVIVREKKKTGHNFVFYPEFQFEGKTKIIVGDSLSKAYEKLSKDTDLKNKLITDITQLINVKLVIASRDKLNTIKDFISESQTEWQNVKPPRTGQSSAYEYWKKGNDSLTNLLKNVTERNIDELLKG